MYGIIPATKPMLKASGIVNLNKITKIDRFYNIYDSPKSITYQDQQHIEPSMTMIEIIEDFVLPYISMYVKQDNVKPSFFELLKRQIRNQRRSHQKECVDRR